MIWQFFPLLKIFLFDCQEGPISFFFLHFYFVETWKRHWWYKWNCCRIVWPRDLCYVRYWRRNDDGSYGMCVRPFVHLDLFPLFASIEFPLFFFFLFFPISVLVQLCYSVLENTRTAVHNLDLSVPILRVTPKLFFSFMIQTGKKFLYSLSFSFFLSYLLTIIYMSSILE